MGTEKRERQKANRALKQQQVERAQTRRQLLRKVALAVAAVVAIVVFVWIASTITGGDDGASARDGSPVFEGQLRADDDSSGS